MSTWFEQCQVALRCGLLSPAGAAGRLAGALTATAMQPSSSESVVLRPLGPGRATPPLTSAGLLIPLWFGEGSLGCSVQDPGEQERRGFPKTTLALLCPPEHSWPGASLVCHMLLDAWACKSDGGGSLGAHSF